MRDSRTHQPLTYDVRLPDEVQADALRLLDESKAVVNAALTILWPHLDEFATDRVGPAWKQVGKYIGSPSPHGDRQWRCESETVGRILRQEDDSSFVALHNVIEQACNFFFQHDRFPSSYEELQPLPLLKVGMLTYAGDDGGEKGQAYRLALDLDAGVARFRFRYPDSIGVWHWRKADTIIPLPDAVRARLSDGDLMAPTLREEHRGRKSGTANLGKR